MTRGLILIISLLIYSCQNADITDTTKRNENWSYWVDSITGVASWIPVSDTTTVKDGRYTLFYSKGTIYEKGKLRSGKNVDTVYCYDLNENLIKYKLIKQDTLIQYYLKDGPYTAYFQNGSIHENGIAKNHDRGNKWTRYFKNGNIEWIELLEGYTGWTIWYYDNGQVSDSTYHINGKGHGRVKHWHRNGKVSEITNWNLGVQNGPSELYYENGQMQSRCFWVNGLRDGIVEGWYENGKKEYIQPNKNGQLSGQVMEWYANGNYKLKADYIFGVKSGKFFKFYENGVMQCDGEMENGKQTGLWLWFEESGKLKQKDTYIDGKLTNVEK